MNRDKGFIQNEHNNEDRLDREPVPQGTTRIPVIEEHLRVGKEVVETEKIRISKKVHTDDVTVDVPISREELSVERIAKNEYVDEAPPAVRYEGEVTIIPVLKEVLVKRLVLVEEVHITKRKVKDKIRTDAVLRTEEVKVDRDRQ